MGVPSDTRGTPPDPFSAHSRLAHPSSAHGAPSAQPMQGQEPSHRALSESLKHCICKHLPLALPALSRTCPVVSLGVFTLPLPVRPSGLYMCPCLLPATCCSVHMHEQVAKRRWTIFVREFRRRLNIFCRELFVALILCMCLRVARGVCIAPWPRQSTGTAHGSALAQVR